MSASHHASARETYDALTNPLQLGHAHAGAPGTTVNIDPGNIESNSKSSLSI